MIERIAHRTWGHRHGRPGLHPVGHRARVDTTLTFRATAFEQEGSSIATPSHRDTNPRYCGAPDPGTHVRFLVNNTQHRRGLQGVTCWRRHPHRPQS
jgi:hypothetical protein